MNDSEFEKHLQRQPLRQVPQEWRAGILQNAVSSHPTTHDPRPSLLAVFLWPHPKAWAGLAALWVVIFAVQFAASDHPVHITKEVEAPSPDALIVLQQETQLMAEVVGRTPPHEADRPKPSAPQPRSDRHAGISFA
jgi:hypothetical protein